MWPLLVGRAGRAACQCPMFFYLENRQPTLDTPTDKIMMDLTPSAGDWFASAAGGIGQRAGA